MSFYEFKEKFTRYKTARPEIMQNGPREITRTTEYLAGRLVDAIFQGGK